MFVKKLLRYILNLNIAYPALTPKLFLSTLINCLGNIKFILASQLFTIYTHICTYHTVLMKYILMFYFENQFPY